QSVTRNIVLSALPKLSRAGFLRQRQERRAAAPVADAVQVAPLLDRIMSSLSGGNQQRGLIGRLLMTGADTIVLEDPTLGVDVAARAAIHDLLKGVVASGRSCVVGSSEPEELALLCNRVLIFRSGQLVQELTGEEVTERRIIQGITSHEKVS
ncbi:MAG: sugar ABC transporter ATP-binding protein, partial [Actinomycetes bacterium]